MSETATTEKLYCELGQHSWERERVRGVKPKSCPEHKPQPERGGAKLSKEERQARMQAGRAKANAARAVEGIERVRVYREFLKLDSAYWAAVKAHREGDPDVVVPMKPKWPAIPTKADYAAAGVDVDILEGAEA